VIVCERCGSQNADRESFCGACGAFLEWEGAPAATTPAVTTPAVTTTPGPAPANAPGVPVAPPAAPVAPAPVPRAPVPRAPVPTAPTVGAQFPPPVEPPEPPGPPHVNPPAAPGVSRPEPESVAERDLDPERRGPAAVRPGEAVRRRPTPGPVPADEPPPAAGDLICGQCGAGNDPSRRFCRRCGASLVTARVVAPPPWWRRLLARLRRRGRPAGYRRPVRQPVRIRGRLVVLFALAAIVLVAALPGRGWVRTGTEIVRDRSSPHVPVTPVASRASSSAPAAGPERLLDGVSNQFWAPVPTGSAEGQWFEVDLPDPTRVLDLVIHSGVSADRKQFLTQARPRELTVTFTAEDGQTRSKVIRLRDQPGKQEFQVRVARVVRVRFTLRSAYGAQPNRRVAVAELEVFGRG